jgi:hypothetical protein
MTKYIRVEDACAEVDRGDLLVGNNAEWAKEIICRTKPADVQEVKYGYWQIESDEDMPDPMFKLVVCSVCEQKANHTYDYCPNCGSHMVQGIK